MVPARSVPQRNNLVMWYDTSSAVSAFTDIHVPEDKTNIYAADDGNTQVFYLENVIAAISSFTHEPEGIRF